MMIAGSRTIEGRGLAPGVGVGMAYRIEPQHPSFFRIRISHSEIQQELLRFRRAVDQARQDYLADKAKFERAVGREHSYIIEAHLLMLEDRQLLDEIERRISEELDSPERAIRHVADELLKAYRSLDDPFFRERVFDFEEVVDRILANLMQLRPPEEKAPEEDLVLVANEIGLSILARFPLEKVKGLVLSRAGETSHVVIVARSYEIPVVSGISQVREEIHTGQGVILDGTAGTVEIAASPEAFRRQLEIAPREERSLVEAGDLEPCYTRDGCRVHLYANTEFGSEVESAFRFGAEGIGLFRSEYLFMSQGRVEFDESRHEEVYRQLARLSAGKLALVRTLDIAQGKDLRVEAGEESAALGLRGIRMSLRDPDPFLRQLRAILRARAEGDLRIMLPMVTSVDEVRQVRSWVRQLEDELDLNQDPVQIGVLLEVPAAFLTAEAIAGEADFLSVGTNDLIQYTLAAGRTNQDIADLYNPMHPAVLEMLSRVARVADRTGSPVVVCGEMAANPLHAAVLIGLGFRRLSVTPVVIPRVKKALRLLDSSEVEQIASGLLGLSSPVEVVERLAHLSEQIERSGLRLVSSD